MNKLKDYIKKVCRPAFAYLSRYTNYVLAPLEYKNSNDCETIQVHPESLYHRIYPLHLGELHNKFLLDAPGITRNSAVTFYQILQAAKIVSANGAILSKNNTLLIAFSSEIGAQPGHHSLLGKTIVRQPKWIKGFSFILAGPNADDNYFHWMTDALPKIEIARTAGYPMSSFDSYIVSKNIHPFQKESLAILGIDSLRTISLTKHPYVIAEKVFVPSATCLSGNVSQWIIKFLRESFASFMLNDDLLPKKIFISRKNAQKRKLLNEPNLQAFLEKQGYTTIVLEGMSVKDQVKLFFNAKHIVGVHGAGLTNIVFCQPGTSLIELFPPGYVNQCYWTLASINQLKYGYYIGEVETAQIDDGHLNDSDFSVSLTALHKLQNNF